MNTSYQPVEVTAVDPKVAQLQARAESYLNQGAADGWGLTLSRPEPDKAKISAEIEGWLKGKPESTDRPMARPGTPIAAGLDDRELLAKTLMAEAGGEGYEGLVAAGSVIANRANSGKYGNGLRGVIMKPGQFSAWNLETGYAKGEGGLNMDAIRPNELAYRAADAIITGNYQDPTGGATHYYNPAVASPKWGQTADKPWQKIGNHVFGWAD